RWFADLRVPGSRSPRPGTDRTTVRSPMSNTPLLEIRNLHANIGDKEILKGLSLTVRKGEVHAIMGPNGSGKSTLANVLMGHPGYKVTRGDVLFKGQELLGMKVDERARQGLFLAFQYPVAIP